MAKPPSSSGDRKKTPHRGSGRQTGTRNSRFCGFERHRVDMPQAYNTFASDLHSTEQREATQRTTFLARIYGTLPVCECVCVCVLSNRPAPEHLRNPGISANRGHVGTHARDTIFHLQTSKVTNFSFSLYLGPRVDRFSGGSRLVPVG